jgi:hypothetical protein
MCNECGRGVEAPLPMDQDRFSYFLALRAWFVVVLTPPGQVPILLGALCGDCARKVFSPEIFQAGEERRQKLIQGTP